MFSGAIVMTRVQYRLRMLARASLRRRGLIRDERGVTAIEFGVLALPFFALIGAILETALVFLAGQVFDTAVQDSARLIRTGQAQNAGFTVANFRTSICDGLYGLFDCSQVKVKVTTIANFSTAGTTEMDDIIDEDDGTWQISENFTPGLGSSIVLVEAYYKWPTYLSFFGFDLASLPDGTRLLGSARLFRNEPF